MIELRWRYVELAYSYLSSSC